MSLERMDSMVSKDPLLSVISVGAGSGNKEDWEDLSQGHHTGSNCRLLLTRPAIVVMFYRKFTGLKCVHCHLQSLRIRVFSSRSCFQSESPKVRSLAWNSELFSSINKTPFY